MAMIVVTEPQQLAGLLDRVHDWWFDVEKISHDPLTGSVTIFLASKQKELNSQSFDGVFLKISNVIQINIKDTEHVGYYDLNKIIYDPKSKLLKITGGIPIEIDLIINSLNIKTYTEKDI